MCAKRRSLASIHSKRSISGDPPCCKVVGGLEEALDRREGPAPTADSADPLLGPAGYLAVSLVASLLSGALWARAAAARAVLQTEVTSERVKTVKRSHVCRKCLELASARK